MKAYHRFRGSRSGNFHDGVRQHVELPWDPFDFLRESRMEVTALENYYINFHGSWIKLAWVAQLSWK